MPPRQPGQFEYWAKRKEELERRTALPTFLPGEVWRCALGINIGSESDGKGQLCWRPVLILKRLDKTSFVGVPLSTSGPARTSFRKLPITLKGVTRFALVTQFRTLDARRLLQPMGQLEEAQLAMVRQTIQTLLEK